MGTKNFKGTVSVEQNAGRIRLRWRFQKKRFSLNLFLFTKANHLLAKKIALQIEKDIIAEIFDSTLERYKPLTHKAEQNIEQQTLVEHFQFWVKAYRNMDCETDIDYNSTRNMLLRWGSFTEQSVLLHLSNETFGAKTYNRRLTLLKAFFKWATKKNITTENPLEDVLPKKTRRTEKPNRRPFTEEEIKRILHAFKRNSCCSPHARQKHSHYYPFIYFIFKTGVRNAEAVGLRRRHVDIDNNLIHIKEVLARSLKGTNASARVRKETKNGKQRVLPLTADLKMIIEPLLKNKEPDDLVFVSHTGVAIDDSQFQKRVFSKILKELKIEHRVLYACRHTFNSRCIESGLTPVTAAFLMGNNPETALRNYTHQLSLPKDLPSIP
jgi:integrase